MRLLVTVHSRASGLSRPAQALRGGHADAAVAGAALILLLACVPATAQCQFAEVWTLRDESGGFSNAIAIGDGLAAIGAPHDSTTNSVNVSGSVYIYTGTPGQPWTWTQAQLLAPTGVRNNEEFGWSLAQEGDLLVVGARKGDAIADRQSDTGLVYVYQRDAQGIWSQLGVASASAQEDEKLGFSVALSGDTIAAGAPEFDDQLTSRADVGRVVVFERSPGNPDQWVQVESLVPTTSTSGAGFGTSIALAQDTLVVGAGKSAEFFTNAGAAFVYERDSTDPEQWNLLARLAPADLATNDQFGWAVETDGQLILVGARQKNSTATNAGRVYVYRRDTITGQWLFSSPAIIDPPVGVSNRARFGSSISLSGSLVAIGAPSEQHKNTTDPIGTVYLSARTQESTWSVPVPLRQNAPGADSDFGLSLDFQDGLLIVGDPNWNLDAGVPPLGIGRSYWFIHQPGGSDCDGDGISDACEVAAGGSQDCDLDAVPDSCPGTLPIAVWTAEFKGIFSDPDSWCDDLPTAQHNVIFRSLTPDGLSNEVVPIHDHTVRGLEVRRGWPNFLGGLGSITVRAPGTLFAGAPLRVGTLPEHARLDLTGATITVGDDALLGSAVLAVVPGSSAEMLISGPGALLDVSLDLVVGNEGPATLTIADGAVVQCAELRVGSRIRPDAEGILRLPNPAGINDPAPVLNIDVQARVERGLVEIGSRGTFYFQAAGGLIIERTGVVRSDAALDGHVTNIGTVQTLTSPGRLLVRGIYSQVQGAGSLTQIGRLRIDLALGTDTNGDGDPDIDFLEVTQTARLDGGLIVTVAPGFNPPIGARFDIIRAGTLDAGRFSVASFPGLSDYKFLRLDYDQTADIVGIVVDALTSNQDSSFGDSQGYSVSGSLREAVLGLLTADGFLDLVAVAAGETTVDPGVLFIFQNTGVTGPNGEVFVATTSIPLPPEPVAVDAADLDRDGLDDVAVAHADGSITIIHRIDFNAVPVTFSTLSLPSVIFSPLDILAADLDLGLGADLTLIGADASGNGQVVSLLNRGGTGPGWLGLGNQRTLGTGPGGLIHADVGDLDNDKSLDLVGLRGNGGMGTRLLNLRGGIGPNWNGFGSRTDFDLGIDAVYSDIGDLDNDKELDLFAVGRSGDEGSFAVMLNNGAAVFGAPTVLPLGGAPGRMVLAALDTDDDLDAAVIVDDPVLGPVIRVFRNDFDNGQLAFSRSQDQAPEATPLLLLAGDLDLSGTDDLVVVNTTSGSGGLPAPGRGAEQDVTFLPSISIDPPNPCPPDLNNDGLLDFFDVQVFLNAYVTQSPIADWNGDAQWDIFDVIGFLNAYSAGCP